MYYLKDFLAAALTDEHGLTAVEYALAGGLIAAAMLGAFIALGGTMASIIIFLEQALQAAPGA